MAADAAFALPRVWTYAWSIVLEAVPYLLAGALAGVAAARLRAAAPLVAVLMPACDCAMNAFASSMRAAPRQLAGFALVWGACCGPIALATTYSALGLRMVAVRVAAGLLAALATAALWSIGLRPTVDMKSTATLAGLHPVDDARSTAPSYRWREILEETLDLFAHGVRSFWPAALAGAVAIVAFSGSTRTHASASWAALIGAAVSPCSTADAILARALFPLPAAQAAFVVAAQCIDVRQLLLLRRHFGTLHATLAAVAAALGVCAAALLAGLR